MPRRGARAGARRDRQKRRPGVWRSRDFHARSSILLFPLRPYWYTGTTVLRTEYDAEEIQFGKKVAESFEVYTGERNVNDTSRS